MGRSDHSWCCSWAMGRDQSAPQVPPGLGGAAGAACSQQSQVQGLVWHSGQQAGSPEGLLRSSSSHRALCQGSGSLQGACVPPAQPGLSAEGHTGSVPSELLVCRGAGDSFHHIREPVPAPAVAAQEGTVPTVTPGSAGTGALRLPPSPQPAGRHRLPFGHHSISTLAPPTPP